MTMTITDLDLGSVVIDAELDFRTTGEDITDLAASIAEHGLMQPITVAPPNGDGKHHVIAGRRRLRAFQELGHKTIPAIVRDDMTDESAQVIGQIIENLHRTDITPIDEARSFAKLMDFGIKQKDIAAHVNCSPGHVSGRLALLKLDDKIVDRVLSGEISTAVATKLARAPKAVRDDVAKAGVIDERTIASAQRGYDEAKKRRDAVGLLTDAGVLAATPDRSGWMNDEAKAELLGLTDEDKPKSHDWDSQGTVGRDVFESDDEWVAEIVSAKPKGVVVMGYGDRLIAFLLGSANLDKERKKEAEAREQRIAERQAEEERIEAAFTDALAPIVASPDKAQLIGTLLQAELARRTTFHFNRSEQLRTVAARLDIDVDDEASDDEVLARIFAFAGRSTVDMCRAVLAASTSVDQLLVDQGFMDHYDITVEDHFDQQRAYEKGWVTLDDLDEDLAAEIRAEQESEAEYDEAVNALITEMVAAQKEEQGVDELSDEEMEAIADQAERQVEGEA